MKLRSKAWACITMMVTHDVSRPWATEVIITPVGHDESGRQSPPEAA